MTEQTATKTTPRSLKPCTCRLFEVGEFDAEKEDGVDFTTECGQMTNRLFAQGHDAKLVSFLVRGHLDGYEIRRTDGGVAITFPGPVEAASSVSEALGAKAKGMLDVAQRRAAEKAARLAAKEAKKAEKAAAAKPQQEDAPVQLAPIEARIKIGRWEYNAQIDRDTKEATYATKLGGTKTAKEGEYSVL